MKNALNKDDLIPARGTFDRVINLLKSLEAVHDKGDGTLFEIGANAASLEGAIKEAEHNDLCKNNWPAMRIRRAKEILKNAQVC